MTTDAPARTKRPERPQAILTVTATEAVTPNLIRITAGGEGFDAIKESRRPYVAPQARVRLVSIRRVSNPCA